MRISCAFLTRDSRVKGGFCVAKLGMPTRIVTLNGAGTVEITNLATPAELNDKGRLFAKITLNPGCSIGYHVHEKDSELFYILKGTAEYNDIGERKTVTAGDVTVCPAGSGHSIANHTDETAELVAVIVYA